MKPITTILATLCIFWSPLALSEYCTVNEGNNARSCIFRVDRIPNNTQIIISYTQQGWSMMIAVFFDEFAIIEGTARVKFHKGETFEIEHVNTRRDMTPTGRMMEAAMYKVSEELLHEMGRASGKIRFYLATDVTGEEEVEVHAKLFSEIDNYIAETKEELGALFDQD
jgi:hypothetical protein